MPDGPRCDPFGAQPIFVGFVPASHRYRNERAVTDERPSQHGAILGEALSDLAKAGAVGQPELLDLMCSTCAFREGCMPNQMAATGKVALDCVLGVDDGEGFACHHGMKDGEPTKFCAGFYAAKQAPFDVLKSTLATVKARLENLPADDMVRAAYDDWKASHDPDGLLDVYQLARAYERARP